MKNSIKLILLVLIMSGLVSYKSVNKKTVVLKVPQMDTSRFVVPDDVKVILETSCLPCHGTNGNFKAKAKWNYDKMAESKTTKQISKLAKIISKVEKGKMPPSKYIKKHPDKNLTANDEKSLINWADKLAESLIK